MRRFRLAPMSGLLLWFTVLVVPIPVALLLLAFVTGVWGFGAVAAFIGSIFLVVWFYLRPSWFIVGSSSLTIQWPVRRRETSYADMVGVERLTGREFRDRYGLGYRIGAGGLWGGFGLYRTRSTTFQFYISRTDDFVVIHRRDDRPLMITPADPGRFVGAIQASLASPD